MQNKAIKHWIFLSVCLLMAGACRKNVTEPGGPNTQLTFLNYSEHLSNQLASYGICFVLFDTPDTSVADVYGNVRNYPTFQYGPTSDLPALPLQYGNAGSAGTSIIPVEPWIPYMNVSAGRHNFTLTDSAGHHAMVGGQINTSPAGPISVFFADSLGAFRYWTRVDTPTPAPAAIGLRIADLSPDAGAVFFTVNKQPVAGAPASLQYGDITPFLSLPTPVSDTLIVRFYSTADSLDVLAKTYLYADPGHSYTLVLKGYQNDQTYPDPKDPTAIVSLSQDISIIIDRNN